jgi:long-chain acyl-CoA synthetase
MRWDAELPVKPVQQILDDAAARWPEHTALEFMGRKTSYRELQELVNRAAAGFQNLGVKPGVHVGLFLPNTPHYVISFFGVLKAGGTVVNYSPLDAAKVLEHKIEDSRTDILVTLDLVNLYPLMARPARQLAPAEAGGRQPGRLRRGRRQGAGPAAGRRPGRARCPPTTGTCASPTC